MSTTPHRYFSAYGAAQLKLKSLLVNGKKAGGGRARRLRVLSVLTALAVALCLAPLFSTSAASLLLSPFLDSDLITTKMVVGSESVQPGQNVTYTIEVRNFGPDDAANVTLTDIIPDGMTFVSLTQNTGSTFTCTTPTVGMNDAPISCTLALMPNGETATFTLVTNIPLQTAEGTFFTNTATVTTSSVDTNEENNSSSATVIIPVPNADLRVSKFATSETVREDMDATFTIEVRNTGPDSANNVNLSDTLPGTMTFVSLMQTSGPTFSCTTPAAGAGGTISCDIMSLPANGVATFTLVGHIPSGTSPGTEFQNIATVSSSTKDFNPDNNQSLAVVTVVNCTTNPVVTTNADSGAGSLRQAIADVCATVGSNTITFSSNVPSPITLTSGELLINKNLTIAGPGANLMGVRRGTGTPNFRIFNVTSGITATISGLTLSNGNLSVLGDTGGGILNDGTLNLISVAILGNSSASVGGGIYNNGTLTIINSAITNNSAVLNGGGIYNNSGTLNITNSTVSTNSAQGFGGGIYFNNGGGTFTNVTIANNRSDSNNAGGETGGGIFINSGTPLLRNTIVALNFRGSGTTPDDISGGNVNNTSAFNLIGTGGSGGLTNANNNQVGVANPGLGPLADNGGPTQTHALLLGSPAMDAGNNAFLPADTFNLDNDGDFSETLPVDQRGPGFVRVADSADPDTTQTVDVGAYEAQVSIQDIANIATNEDTPLAFSFNVGDASLINIVTATSSNTTLVPNNPANLSIIGTGSTRTIQINPAPNQSGTTTITVTAIGSNSQMMSDTFVLTVNAVNDAPVATNDSYSTNENTPLNVAAPGVLQNDTDVEGASLMAMVVSNPSNGTLTLNADGSFLYTPTAGFSGTDSFTYKARDGALDSNVATVQITVNEGGALQFTSSTYTVAENAGSAPITIVRMGGSAGTATVLFSTSNGTATAGDYTSASQTVTFNDGETSKTINVPIANDTTDEPDQTINLTLSQVGGTGQLGTPSTAVLTIIDDDNPPTISVDDIGTSEGNGGFKIFTLGISLSAPSEFVVKVDLATADGTATAGSDYHAISSTITINPGEQGQLVTLIIIADEVNEPDEDFFVNLSNPQNATISDAQAKVTIFNDDTPFVEFTRSSYVINEGENNTPQGFTSLSVLVRRNGDTSGTASVRYFTHDDSGNNECNQVTGFASQRCDYTFSGGIIRFAAGEAIKTITIPIINDGYQEGNEIFTIELQNAVGTTIAGNNQAVVTIQDDAADATPTTPQQNPYLSNAFFVRQLYLDFLDREPDSAGYNDWLNVLNNCGSQKGFLGAPPTCDRAHVAHGFFTSPESTNTAFLIYRLYEVGIGRLPLYMEFIPDMALLKTFNVPPAEQQQNLDVYLQEFTSKPGFITRFGDSLQPSQAAQLISKLEQAAGVTLPATATTLPGQPTQYGRQELINLRANGTFTVGQTLKAFVEQKVVYDKYFTRGEVTLLYFALLRRDPSLNDPNLVGWNDWVDVFTNGRPSAGIPPRDIHHLIFGFIYSEEYRKRFGAP
ncbi:MAG: DUF11 domain-containing protein [Pyrinomonadaceae bacterium]|nr:DUF11 domain-containing protein [Pyrinomonadaceae bacterium]